jgi:hypothetical protein
MIPTRSQLETKLEQIQVLLAPEVKLDCGTRARLKTAQADIKKQLRAKATA